MKKSAKKAGPGRYFAPDPGTPTLLELGP